ncbi:hypothetical protein [Bacillus sp. FJAT-28004]|uniref:hypothetical protein n=1 Tax=Bacillus sp. FJAT-28004 TaxID=1679165 RepID=UPI0006B54550|nr:hypothetical protein [Bacillus sp. FJAT-28004]
MADLIPPGSTLKAGKNAINAKIAVLEAEGASQQKQINAEEQARIAADVAHAGAAVAHTAEQIQYGAGQSVKQKFDSQQAQIATEEQARIVADALHAGSAVAHTSEQIQYAVGQSVKQKLDLQQARIDNIIGGPASSPAEPVDARLGADGTARPTLGTLIREIHGKQLAQNDQSTTIKQGTGVINTSQASTAEFTIQGRTLVNLLGRDGNFEKDSNGDGVADGWGLVSVISPSLQNGAEIGSKFQRFIASGGGIATGIQHAITLSAGKYYVIIGRSKVINGGDPDLQSNMRIANAANAQLSSSTLVTSGTWSTIYIKRIADGTEASVRLCGSGNAGNRTCDFDGIRIYEVSAEEYAKIDVDPEYTGEKLAAKFPYVDSVQHLVNPVIRKKGKNLMSTRFDVIHAEAVITAPYKLTLTANAAWREIYIDYPVVPNTAYILYVVNNGVIALKTLDANKAQISSVGYSSVQTFTKTTEANAAYIRVMFSNSTVGTFTFSDWQLELGNVATQFEPQNDDYMYLPTLLASNVDGSVRDTYNSALGTVSRRIKTGVVLDGSLLWNFPSGGDYTGFKRVRVSNWSTIFPIFGFTGGGAQTSIGKTNTQKFNGQILVNADYPDSWISSDRFGCGSTYDLLDIAIADPDSGWGETYTPSTPEMQAYFNGWQMNNGTVGTPYASGTKKWTPLVSPKATLEGKIAGSVVENPHIVKWGFNNTLISPSGSWGGEDSQAQYDTAKTLDGVVRTMTTATIGQISQRLESKNLIEHVLHEHGSWVFGAASTVAERVAWLKDNVLKLAGNWFGNASGSAGNKAYLNIWKASTNLWQVPKTHTSAAITALNYPHSFATATLGDLIDVNGFVHFIAYADAAGPIANPTTAPVLSASGTGSGLAAGTYYVHYAFLADANGETIRSPEASITITSGQNINVTVPAMPFGTRQTNIYMGTATGVTKRQSNTKTTAYIQSTALDTTSANSPVSNTSVVLSAVNTDYFELEVELNVSVLPTAKPLSYTPYTLDYQFAAAVEETVVAEGSIGLQSGGNQVELIEGVVIRELATPGLYSGYYRISDNVSAPSGNLENKNEKIIDIYKNGIKETSKWQIDTISPYGNQRAIIKESDYDVTAEYTVTYLPLDKFNRTTNAIDMTVQYKSNPKMVQDQLVQNMADLETQGSINVRAIAELYKRVKALGG